MIVSVIDKLCNALSPRPSESQDRHPSTTVLSPMQKAELRSMKQLSELRQLCVSGVLTEEEYEKQRKDLVELMRQLKDS